MTLFKFRFYQFINHTILFKALVPFFTVIMIASNHKVYSQADFKVRNIGIDQGLSNNSVTEIYKDNKGFMWIGTYDGLNRFDGYEFRIFRNRLDDSTSLINNRIVCVTESQDKIWVGTKWFECI